MAAPNDSGSGPANSPPRPSYVPKFSAATEMILQRLRGVGGPLAPNSQLSLGNPLGVGAELPPGYEDVKRTVMEGYKTTLSASSDQIQPSITVKVNKPRAKAPSTATSKTNTPKRGDSTPTMSSTKAKGSTRSRTRIGNKRKRVKEDESDSPEESDLSGLGEDSESEEPIFIPTQTLSGRKVVKPAPFVPSVPQEAPAKKKGPAHYNKKNGRNIEQALCKRCARGNSPNANQIVFCDQCNNGWHQLCHDPVVGNDVVKDINAPWFCSTCTAKRAARANKGKNAGAAPTAKTTTPATANMIPTPAPQPAKQVAGWGRLNNEQKREYLARFPPQHLILLFIHATNLHPDLPMPPLPNGSSNMGNAMQRQQNKGVHVYPQQPFPPSATAGLFSRSETNPNAPMNFIRKRQAQAPESGFPSGGGYTNGPHGLTHANSSSSSAPMMDNPVFQNAMDVDMNLDYGLDDLHGMHSMGGSLHGMDSNGHFPRMGEMNGQGESRESTPASPPYPKPGTGMMSRLKTDEEELEWLVGNGEGDEAFSHAVLEAGMGN